MPWPDRFITFDDYPENPGKYPKFYDGKLFAYDWMRGWMMAVSFDESGNMKNIEPFVPSIEWSSLMDVVMSPQGDLYMIEYGKGWYSANRDSRLVHLKYTPGNRAPEARITTDKLFGPTPLTVAFDGSESIDPDDDNLRYSWNFGDGATSTGATTEHTFDQPGEYTVVMEAQDPDGETSQNTVIILAGNTPPELQIDIAGNTQFYWPGSSVGYSINGTDAEDGTIANDKIDVTLEYLEMGYDLTEIVAGHQEATKEPLGLTLINSSDCQSCHRLEGLSVGPSYVDIKEKYDDQQGAVSYLAEKIINGGGGVWGEVAMAAHPNLSESDANHMAEYIMNVGEESAQTIIDAEGVISFQFPDEEEEGGSFFIQASYLDQGGEGTSPLEGYISHVFKPAVLTPEVFDQFENASQFTITPDMGEFIEEEMEVILLQDEAMVTIDQIDLTDIGAITLYASAPSMFIQGGSISISVDDEVVGVPQVIEPSPSMSDIKVLSFPLNISGLHKLTISAEANETNGGVASVASIVLNKNQVN